MKRDAELRHGRTSTYRRHGCRCELCTKVQREACAAYEAKKRAGLDMRPYRRQKPAMRQPAIRVSLKRATDIWPGRP